MDTETELERIKKTSQEWRFEAQVFVFGMDFGGPPWKISEHAKRATFLPKSEIFQKFH